MHRAANYKNSTWLLKMRRAMMTTRMVRLTDVLMKACLIASLAFNDISSTTALPEPLPSTCKFVTDLLKCTEAENLNLAKLAASVMLDYMVSFVYLQSEQTVCTCRVVHFLKLLQNIDVVVLTDSKCEPKTLKKCGVELHLEEPTAVAGLIVSRQNPRFRWGVKHHVTEMCIKVEDLLKADLRWHVYSGIKLELQREEESLTKLAISKGRPMFLHSMDTSTLKTFVRTPEQAKELLAPPSTKTPSLSDTVLKTMNEFMRMTQVKTDESGVQMGPETKVPASETELQETLRSELKGIKTDLGRHGSRRRRREIRRENATRLASAAQRNKFSLRDRDMGVVSSTTGRVLTSYGNDQAVGFSSLHAWLGRLRKPERRPRSFTSERVPRKKRSSAHPYAMPQKVFVNGEFISVFDANAILEGLSLEATLAPPPTIVTEAQHRGNTTTTGPVADHRNPVAAMLFPSADAAGEHVLSHALGELQEDDDDDAVDILEDDLLLSDDVDSIGAAALMAKANRENWTFTVAVNATIGPAKVVKGMSLQEMHARSLETDHRIRSFIIFFVAVIGIITVISVLLILAMKDGIYGDKMSIFATPKRKGFEENRRHKERLLQQHEDMINRKRSIYRSYSDAYDEEMEDTFAKPILGPGSQRNVASSTQGDDKDEDGDQDNDNDTKELYLEDMYNKPLSLGGRHMYTEFEKATHDDRWREGRKSFFRSPSRLDARSRSSTSFRNFFKKNRSASNSNDTGLVSFLDSLVTEPDGVIRSDHREQLNVKRYIHNQKTQEELKSESTSRGRQRRRRNRLRQYIPSSLLHPKQPTLKLDMASIANGRGEDGSLR